MITITAQPEAIDIAGNGLKFEVEGTAFIEVVGTPAALEIEKTGTITEGSVITLKNFDTDQDTNITITAAPDYEANDVALTQNVAELVLNFIAIDFVNTHYIILATGNSIIFQTREKVAYDYLLTIANMPAAFDQVSLTEGIAVLTKSNYSIIGKVFDIDNADSLISEFALSPDNNAAAQVKLGELLSGFALPKIPLFDAISKIITGFNYRINFAEKYEVGGALRTNTASIFEGIALPGRLSAAEADSFSLAAFTAAKNWLNTLQKAEIFECNYMLYWLNDTYYTNYTSINVNVKFYYTDGTTEEIEADSITVGRNEILRIDVAKLLLLSTNIHYKIEVYTSYNTTALSNKYELQITELPLYNSVLYFTNKYGMFEALCLTGKKSQMLQTKRNTAVTYNNFAVSQLDEAYDKFKVGTGPILRDEAEAIKQALLSDKIYIQEDALLVPCVVEDGSFEIIPNDEDLFELEFEYRYAYEL